MLLQRLIILFLLIFGVSAKPIDQTVKEHTHRSRRSLNLMNWESADLLYKHLYSNRLTTDSRMKRAEGLSDSRPVEGPINIEQLPAMLAARKIQRYPFSQQIDPAIIGR